MSRVVAVVCIVAAAVLLYFVAWPVPIDPHPWQPPVAPTLAGVYEANTALAAVERLPVGGRGPEDVALGPDGLLYTGLADGGIIRMHRDGSGRQVFAQTAGRPLGMQFDAEGNLIVADAYRGLLSIAPTGVVTVLATEADGVPFKLTDDLDIGSHGTIYFTDASSKFTDEHVIQDLLEHGGNGRLLAYVPSRKETRVLLGHLQFANGVALSPDESFILVNETGAYRTRRVWLSGERAGRVDTFLDNLPGFPDNISCNGEDLFWIALPTPRQPDIDERLAPSPFMRKLVLRLPATMRPEAEHFGFVLGVDLKGTVVHNLQDPSPNCYWHITSVNEWDDTLYLGSLEENAIARLPVPTAAAPALSVPPLPVSPPPPPPEPIAPVHGIGAPLFPDDTLPPPDEDSTPVSGTVPPADGTAPPEVEAASAQPGPAPREAAEQAPSQIDTLDASEPAERPEPATPPPSPETDAPKTETESPTTAAPAPESNQDVSSPALPKREPADPAAAADESGRAPTLPASSSAAPGEEHPSS